MDKLKTMGFLKSEKDGEKRIAVLPDDLAGVIHCEQLYFEKGYGSDFEISDEFYEQYGCHIKEKEGLLDCDVLCDTKIGEASWIEKLTSSKVLFGWLHAGADKKLCQQLYEQHHLCYAWEDMYEEGRHVFFKNNQLAGAGGVLNALQYTGCLPYGKHAAILGRGDVAMGAAHILYNLGADVRMYNRGQEKLFQREVAIMDVVVITIRWDQTRNDHILTSEIMNQMKKGAIIIDVSADRNGAIENSVPTSISHPTYHLCHTLLYSVNNVPSIFYKTATQDISPIVASCIDKLVEGTTNEMLRDALYTPEKLKQMLE